MVAVEANGCRAAQSRRTGWLNITSLVAGDRNGIRALLKELTSGQPAVYFLATGSRRDDLQIEYVGETCDLFRRTCEHVTPHDNLAQRVLPSLRAGRRLFLKFRPCSTKEEAVSFERGYLDVFSFPWNIRNNVVNGGARERINHLPRTASIFR